MGSKCKQTWLRPCVNNVRYVSCNDLWLFSHSWRIYKRILILNKELMMDIEFWQSLNDNRSTWIKYTLQGESLMHRQSVVEFSVTAVADLRGAPGTRPPLSQNFFIFMQFLRKIRQIVGWRPPLPLGLAHPPLGNPRSATEQFTVTISL